MMATSPANPGPHILNEKDLAEVQRLAVFGYSKAHCSLHLVLKVKEAPLAREFLAWLLNEVTFGCGNRSAGVNIGFTYRGLQALGLPDGYLRELETKAYAFSQGASARAARKLGDAGESSAERWEPVFTTYHAHVLISIHGETETEVRAVAKRYANQCAKEAFGDWLGADLFAKHLPPKLKPNQPKLKPNHVEPRPQDAEAPDDSPIRTAHFDLRDGIAQPKIAVAGVPGTFSAGEMLLGHLNDQHFDRWADGATSEENKRFFRNGCFGIFRKIEQHEELFNQFLDRQVAALKGRYPRVSRDFLKAKLCGRWPNGSRVEPDQWEEPEFPDIGDFEFKKVGDADGSGCPFGSHIRRNNPRDDAVAPSRRRPLFRRGMPYGPVYSTDTKDKPRGLIGLFFCASIEDQFEHVMSEWVEKTPVGPPSRGTAKDPLVGHNDDPTSDFDIPLKDGGRIRLTGFAPFVTTRGTLYAFFPSRTALLEIARGLRPVASQAAYAPRPSAAPRVSDESARRGSSEVNNYHAPNDRFCDVVMEGGVTSGIIYASAVSELANYYRFRSIGGSSIGAFAAALTAAAEYRRRTGSVAGFERVDKLPTKLAELEGNRTLLERLFRPQKGTRRLFAIFLATLGDKWILTRAFNGLATALRQYWCLVLGAALLALVFVLAGPLALTPIGLKSADPAVSGLGLIELGAWGPALLIALLNSIGAALLIGIGKDLCCGLMPNGFGLCRGWSPDAPFGDPFDSSDLTGFMHASIQATAGRRPIDDPPLTFKDLWDAPGGPSEVLGFTGSAPLVRSIVLEVYTTNLAHGRPYRFPLDESDDMGKLFFCEKDLLDYFPKSVVNHLIAAAPSSRLRADPESKAVGAGERYYELPQENLPIVVAARLALSFPLLISAVPVWAIDFEAPRGQRRLERCWLSDGGLCSNFPIHLFDSFMPKWPTFGIALHTRGKHRPGTLVWLPKKHYEGRGDTWNRFDEKRGLRRLAGFLLSLWMATWRWNDMTMMRMPGVRDRVVRVLLEDKEGGINIRMTPKDIDNLARNYGRAAAREFIGKFVNEDLGWLEHRWVRLNRLLISLRRQIEGFAFAADLDKNAQPLADRIREARLNPPLRGSSHGQPSPSEIKLTDEQASELNGLLVELRGLESIYNSVGDSEPYRAMPRPSLRVRHPT
jgi:deferrochelatase/peroxidase EfeB/predicted acylesterase/phospholipase RssA